LEGARPPRLVVTTQDSLVELRGILVDEALASPVAEEEAAPWEQALSWQKARRTKKLVALRIASREP